MSDVLREKLSLVRRRTAVVDVLDGGCRVLLAIVCAFAAIMLLDWFCELPWIMRLIFLALTLSAVGYLIVTRVMFPLWQMPDEDELALRVQRHEPQLGSRLIAAIQLTRAQVLSAGASGSMVRALVSQTEAMTAPIDFRRIVQLDSLRRTGIIAGVVVVLALIAMTCAGADGRDLLERALLVPGVDVPRRTHVELLTANPKIIGKGDPVELRARAIGIVPPNGSIALSYDGERDSVQLPIGAVADVPGEFAATISSVSQSFTYRIRLNDGRSEEGHIRASVRPAITKLAIQQFYPAYTHLAAIQRMPNDLQLLAGSRLAFHISSSSPLHSATPDVRAGSHLIFHSPKGDVLQPLTLGGTAELNTRLPIEVPVDATGLAVVLVDADGLESAEPVVYPITILPDQPPTVSVTFPLKKEELSTSLAQLIVGVDARDDFALDRVRFCYRVMSPSDSAGDSPPVDASDVKATGTIEFQLGGTPRQFKGRYPFDLATLQPRPVEGGSVEWWLEAQDTNNVTGPGRASSDHFLTRIASEAEGASGLVQPIVGTHGGAETDGRHAEKRQRRPR